MTRQSPISSRASIAASAKPTIPSALKANAEVESFIDNAEGVPDQRQRRSRSAPKAFVDQRRRRSSIQRPKAFPINAEGVPNQRRRRSRISAQGCFNPRKRKQSTSTTLKALANQRC